MKNNKYTIIYEGDSEKYLFFELKTKIFKNKMIQKCKKHKPIKIEGTISKTYYDNKKNCCKAFYIIDKDKIKSEILNKINEKILKNKDVLILSDPCIEIILLSIFSLTNPNEKDIKEKLTKSLIENKIIKSENKYSKSSGESLKKIIAFLEQKPEKIVEWQKNLKKIEINRNNIKFNNFNILINFLKGDKNEK